MDTLTRPGVLGQGEAEMVDGSEGGTALGHSSQAQAVFVVRVVEFDVCVFRRSVTKQHLRKCPKSCVNLSVLIIW